MAATVPHPYTAENSFVKSVRRAMAEFLWLPTAIVVGFLFLAAGGYLLDRMSWAWLIPINQFLHTYILADVQATSQLLRTIASGLMTVTSVTISILLLALQQSATAMTTAVFDQFLRRRHNQFYFGYFVGLTLYTLITLATVNAPFNPVISATLALCLTIVALFLLIILLYTTINQIRPAEILNTIHFHTLAARRRQLALLARTRRHSQYAGIVRRSVRTTRHGMVIDFAVDATKVAIEKSGVQVEIVVKAPIGSYVAFQDEVAVVHAATERAADELAQVVQSAFAIERKRDITTDPEYGIEQMMTIAWSSISSAKSDIAPGLLTIYSLRDILARWSTEEEETTESKEQPRLPIVYPDGAFTYLLHTLESLAVISSESMQHQIFAAIVRTLADLFKQLPNEQQQQAEVIICRLLSALGDHVLTSDLDAALSALAEALYAANKKETATAVQQAQAALTSSVGVLRSRTTRALFTDAPETACLKKH